jgi:hypothetical protein
MDNLTNSRTYAVEDALISQQEDDTVRETSAVRVGRPSKASLAAKKPGNRGQVGRPKGDAAIMNEYKARMLNSPKSQKVLRKVLDAALDDEHKHQAICMKMVMDRVLPIGAFEADVKRGRASGGINITITGVGQASVEGALVEGDLEAEYSPIREGREETEWEDQ